jgi:hypothetical protein
MKEYQMQVIFKSGNVEIFTIKKKDWDAIENFITQGYVNGFFNFKQAATLVTIATSEISCINTF